LFFGLSVASFFPTGSFRVSAYDLILLLSTPKILFGLGKQAKVFQQSPSPFHWSFVIASSHFSPFPLIKPTSSSVRRFSPLFPTEIDFLLGSNKPTASNF